MKVLLIQAKSGLRGSEYASQLVKFGVPRENIYLNVGRNNLGALMFDITLLDSGLDEHVIRNARAHTSHGGAIVSLP